MFHYLNKYFPLITSFLCLLACNSSNVPQTDQSTDIIELESSILGKMLCGYQGWFNAEGDGSDLGWKHYSNTNGFVPGSCSIDYWPDVTGFDEDEIFSTSFYHDDGKKAFVFSSAHPKTVGRHFNWMRDYGIDGVFVQRFVSTTKNSKLLANLNQVFDNCHKGAVESDRLISVMYDLSGSTSTDVVENTKKDWKQLVDRYKLNDSKNPNLLTYKGKTVVSIWGVGFKNRDYTLQNIETLVDFFKNDPQYGNCSVLLGVPTGWRTLDRDCISDPKMHELIKKADIVHPWTPGRYNNLDNVDEHRATYTVQDKTWCDENQLLYMPVVFPGFSWHNLKKGSGENAPLAAIPRLKGDFLWRQFYNASRSGAETIYVAMFDEMDEGTCIFKITDNPPVGESPFLTYEGLPSDYYLWLTGQAARMLRKEVPVTETKPSYPERL